MCKVKIIQTGLFFLLCFGICPPFFAQDNELIFYKSDTTQHFKVASLITDPPSIKPRAMAEWEELGAIALCWDLSWSNERKDLLAEIAKHAKKEVEVLIFCQGNDFDLPRRVKSELAFRGLDDENITFIPRNFDSRIWIRDFGAHSIYLNEVDSLVFLDWLYEPEYREADTEVSGAMAGFFGTTLYSTIENPYRFKLDGGNFFPDGMGLGFSSTHIFDDNPYQNAAFDSIVRAFMGLGDYIKMEKLDYDVIHHLDMHLKLLDEETLLVGQYPEGVADGPKIEANLQFLLDNFKTSFGSDFKIHRIPMPADPDGFFPDEINGCSNLGNGCYLTYTNALFINKTILVPQYFGGLGEDLQALKTWQELKPGYQILGIDCRDIIRDYGAIHCVSKEIGVKDPLLIVHQKLKNQCPTAAFYPIETSVQHRSGIEAVNVFYKKKEDLDFKSSALLSADGKNWSGYIPPFPAGTKLEYYIEAKANSQKILRRPLAAPAASWHFEVDCLVGTAEVENPENEIKIFPNPAKNEVQVEFQKQPYFFKIFDLNGHIKFENLLGSKKNGKKKLEVDISQFSSGFYLVQFYFDDKIITKKLLVR